MKTQGNDGKWQSVQSLIRAAGMRRRIMFLCLFLLSGHGIASDLASVSTVCRQSKEFSRKRPLLHSRAKIACKAGA